MLVCLHSSMLGIHLLLRQPVYFFPALPPTDVQPDCLQQQPVSSFHWMTALQVSEDTFHVFHKSSLLLFQQLPCENTFMSSPSQLCSELDPVFLCNYSWVEPIIKPCPRVRLYDGLSTHGGDDLPLSGYHANLRLNINYTGRHPEL